jgi:hypothetical protein
MWIMAKSGDQSEELGPTDIIEIGGPVETIEGVEADEDAEISRDLHLMFLLRNVGESGGAELLDEDIQVESSAVFEAAQGTEFEEKLCCRCCDTGMHQDPSFPRPPSSAVSAVVIFSPPSVGSSELNPTAMRKLQQSACKFQPLQSCL